LAASVARSISQPSSGRPLQSAKPALQAYRQFPSEHAVTIMFGGALAAHSLPQPPQWFASFAVSVSQPSRSTFSSALQSAYPALQAMLHTPPAHEGAPLEPLHGAAHPPQLFVSFPVSVSQPSRVASSSALQSANPGLHVMLQTPPPQFGVPPTVLHASKQDPQLAASVARSTSQPSPGRSLQSAKLALQAYWQLPSEHPAAIMFAGALAAHSLPHVPQLLGSMSELVSQPSRIAFSSALQSA
jgi:hypothetical protein